MLAAVLLLVWIAAFFVPAGAYDTTDGGPVPGTYHRLPNCASAPEGEQCVDTSAGPNEAGFLYGSAPIFLFVLAVGASITVTMNTEAIQTGIGRSRSW